MGRIRVTVSIGVEKSWDGVGIRVGGDVGFGLQLGFWRVRVTIGVRFRVTVGVRVRVGESEGQV